MSQDMIALLYLSSRDPASLFSEVGSWQNFGVSGPERGGPPLRLASPERRPPFKQAHR